jgi:hypothetical protein
VTDVTITPLPAQPLHAIEIWSNPEAVARRFKAAIGFALPGTGRSDGSDALRIRPVSFAISLTNVSTDGAPEDACDSGRRSFLLSTCVTERG